MLDMDHPFPPGFHPLIAPWFLGTYGEPTAVQREAWHRIAAGQDVLALAPTGSGKTLAAFLDAISRFVLGEYDPARLSVLYVSPLKALNEDIRANLREPLVSLRARFEGEGLAFPDIRVETRSGDTPAADRRRFLVRPPSILATTPESLAILLLSPRGRSVLSQVRLLILDEIHAVLDSKRGAFLACQIGALSLLAGEFRRIALSATVSPAETAAAFVGGLRKVPAGDGRAGFRYEPRPVVVVAPPAEKRIDLSVEYPAPPAQDPKAVPGDELPESSRYAALVSDLDRRIRRNRSTLVFTDSRRRAERIAFLLNEKVGTGAAYAHHGSLSKDVRRMVEERLKAGELPCVVATGSLELGIDVGSVDEVVLAGSPPAVSPALQRVGRSGHGVGRASRGILFPFHGMDLLRAAALAGAVRDREIEPSAPVENPLDILAQAILALCSTGDRDVDALYEDIRAVSPFRTLSRQAYDGVVEMLAGRYESARLRELKPRLRFDRASGVLSAAEGTVQLLYSSGGAIPDRGVYSLRLSDGTRIGELDEEFVWERKVGDAFSFGTRSWRIRDIGPEAVVVVPLDRPADFVPFWKGEARYRSPVLVRRTLELSASFDPGGFPPGVLEDLGMTTEARTALGRFLESQVRAQQGAPLAGPSCLPLELCSDPGLRGDAVTAVLHTLRGGAVNEPLSLALGAELEDALGVRIETIADEDFVLVLLPLVPGVSADSAIRDALARLGDPGRRERRLRSRLERSGVFGAAFREAAGRSLILPRAGFGKRTPLWITRLRSKRLFDAVSSFGDFPVSAEAWRTCLVDLFDLAELGRLLEGIADGRIGVPVFRTRAPSPFAREAVWQETNRFLYEGDGSGGRSGVSLSDRAIEEALCAPALRPTLSAGLVSDFESRLRRELTGWAPEDGPALAEWVKERVFIPGDEWNALAASLGEDAKSSLRNDQTLGGRIARIRPGGLDLYIHEERRPEFEADPRAVLAEWLRYEGPVAPARVGSVLGIGEEEALSVLATLAEEGILAAGVRVEGWTEDLFCDETNLELLLRLTRKAARPRVDERPLSDLPLFLARIQGLVGNRPERPWAPLAGWAAPVRLWESDLLPARDPEYTPARLDRDFAEGRCLWFGAGRETAGICAPEDLDLVLPDRPSASEVVPDGFADFWAVRDASGRSVEECVRILWEEAWRGMASSDSWETLRSGLRSGFGFRASVLPDAGYPRPEPSSYGVPRRIPRALRDRWRGGPPVAGRWFSLAAEGDPDPLDRDQLDRERVRLLARRWGILCRPLLEREVPALGWARLLRALRSMELAGEILAGRFFAGLGGLQFMSPEAFNTFQSPDNLGETYWLNACDPASLAGVTAEGLPRDLPPRTASSRLCYRGTRLAAVSLRKGREVRVLDDGGDPEATLAFLKIPRTRRVDPERKVVVETVNGAAAADGPYASVLKDLGFEADRGRMVLW